MALRYLKNAFRIEDPLRRKRFRIARDVVLGVVVVRLLSGMFYLLTSRQGGELMHFMLQYLIRPRQAGGPSMLPTLSVVEYVLEEKIRHEWFPHKLRRGDIVTYLSPLDPNQLVCKRIIGLSGDTVCIDPTRLSAPVVDEDQGSGRRERTKPKGMHVAVPKGHIWTQGDNAAASRDSRDYGPVPIALVKGRLICGIGVCLPHPPFSFADFRSFLTFS